MTTENAVAAIREIAAARASNPALARSVASAPLRSVYLLCLRSRMDPADQERLDDAAAVLHRAKDQADADGSAPADKILVGSVMEEW